MPFDFSHHPSTSPFYTLFRGPMNTEARSCWCHRGTPTGTRGQSGSRGRQRFRRHRARCEWIARCSHLPTCSCHSRTWFWATWHWKTIQLTLEPNSNPPFLDCFMLFLDVFGTFFFFLNLLSCCWLSVLWFQTRQTHATSVSLETPKISCLWTHQIQQKHFFNTQWDQIGSNTIGIFKSKNKGAINWSQKPFDLPRCEMAKRPPLMQGTKSVPSSNQLNCNRQSNIILTCCDARAGNWPGDLPRVEHQDVSESFQIIWPPHITLALW